MSKKKFRKEELSGRRSALANAQPGHGVTHPHVGSSGNAPAMQSTLPGGGTLNKRKRR